MQSITRQTAVAEMRSPTILKKRYTTMVNPARTVRLHRMRAVSETPNSLKKNALRYEENGPYKEAISL